MDDCSTDNSLEIINKYKNDPHITNIVVNEHNCGSPFKQWHKGFELAKGELIWVAESDDYCELDFLEKLISVMSKHEDCVIAFCKIISFNEKGERWIATSDLLEEGVYDSFEFISKLMCLGTIIVNASGAIFKKSTAMSIDKEYMNYRGAGDRRFWTELAECGSIVYVDCPLNYFRHHSQNSTAYNYEHGINQLEDLKTLNYIYHRGYINKGKYDDCRNVYIEKRVLSIPNIFLRLEILKKWEPIFIKRLLYLALNKRIRFIIKRFFHIQ